MPESDPSPQLRRDHSGWPGCWRWLRRIAGGRPSSALADDAKLEAYGRHLAQECTSCHRIDGIDNGIPSIIGWHADAFIATMKFYRDGDPHQSGDDVGRKLAHR